MSIRQMFPGSIVKPGFNPLAAQTSTVLYELYGWGSNTDGQIGLGNTTNYSSPKQVGSLTNWLEIAAGYAFSASIKTDGTLWTWGSNPQGQLGLGNSGVYYSSPKQVGSLTSWSKVTTAASSCAAIKTDGTIWSWGQGSNGQLGLGNLTYYSSPKQIGALTNWSSVSGAGSQSFYIALKTDGTIWSWGNNNNGQLGLGDRTNRSSPVQIGA